MSEPLTIWECAKGHVCTGDGVICRHEECNSTVLTEAVLFASENVRSLWEAVQAGAAFGGLSGGECSIASSRFPSPEDWG